MLFLLFDWLSIFSSRIFSLACRRRANEQTINYWNAWRWSWWCRCIRMCNCDSIGIVLFYLALCHAHIRIACIVDKFFTISLPFLLLYALPFQLKHFGWPVGGYKMSNQLVLHLFLNLRRLTIFSSRIFMCSHLPLESPDKLKDHWILIWKM